MTCKKTFYDFFTWLSVNRIVTEVLFHFAKFAAVCRAFPQENVLLFSKFDIFSLNCRKSWSERGKEEKKKREEKSWRNKKESVKGKQKKRREECK